MKSRLINILLFLMVASPAKAEIKDLGIIGETYPIVEDDIVAELREQAQTLKGLAPSGDLMEQIRHYQPANLQALPRAADNRNFLVDMTYTLDHDLKDKNGKVIYPRGYTFNPLDRIRLSTSLVVIDGTDSDQVAWFKESPYMKNRRVKLLISGGYDSDLRRELKRPVFYLTKDIGTRLKLTAVPCVAVQKGNGMQVTEFFIQTNNNKKSQ